MRHGKSTSGRQAVLIGTSWWKTNLVGLVIKLPKDHSDSTDEQT